VPGTIYYRLLPVLMRAEKMPAEKDTESRTPPPAK
jgi:hypothetical protein